MVKKEILEELDLALNEMPSKYFNEFKPYDIAYNFFLDLEHGYCHTAGSRIHLYADANRWVVVFEKSGYYNRGFTAEVELFYFGNCVDYPIEIYEDARYLSNTSRIILIESYEFERIENKDGDDVENFELISKNIEKIKVRDRFVRFEGDYSNYEKLGIEVRDYYNPNKLIGFEDLIRYYNETNPELIQATDEDIRKHIPEDVPKLMTIDEFYFKSFYDRDIPPSQQETYQLIAKILTSKDTAFWKPSQKPNNHWSNWESGHL